MLKARFTQAWLDAHRVEMARFDRSQVVGIGHAMAEVDSLLARLRDPERVALLGAVPPRGILFYGSPGTGKTHLARYLASQLGDGVDLYEIPSDELSPDRLRGAIRSLASAPQKSVVFIDEADSWAVQRAFGTHTPATRLLLTSALSTLSGLVPSEGPIVVVATNRHPAELDPALIRSGRLGTHIFFDLPNEDERAELFALYSRSRPTDGTLDLRRAARLSRDRSPADIQAFVEDAAGLALVAGRSVLVDADLVEALRRAGNILPEQTNSPSRWRTAVHEAGHVAGLVILARAAGRGGDGASWVHAVSIDNDGGGKTNFGLEGISPNDLPDDEHRDFLISVFCGTCSEAAILGEPSLAGADLEMATNRAVQRVEQGWEAGHPPVALAEFGLNVPENLKDSLGSVVAATLVSARAAAERIVAANFGPITTFAKALDAATELTGDELMAAIEAAAFMTPEAA